MADRHQFRACWHDYNEGIYFITVCCAEKRHYFGKIIKGKSELSKIGNIVKATIEATSRHFPEVEILNYVVMPNHIHMVISVGTRHGASSTSKQTSPTSKQTSPTSKQTYGCLRPKRHEAVNGQDFHHNSRLAVIVGQIKSTVKRLANKQDIQFEWQERFHEHIIRTQHAFDNIMNYIDTNVENWRYDRFNECCIDNSDAPWRVPTADNDMATQKNNTNN